MLGLEWNIREITFYEIKLLALITLTLVCLRSHTSIINLNMTLHIRFPLNCRMNRNKCSFQSHHKYFETQVELYQFDKLHIKVKGDASHLSSSFHFSSSSLTINHTWKYILLHHTFSNQSLISTKLSICYKMSTF